MNNPDPKPKEPVRYDMGWLVIDWEPARGSWQVQTKKAHIVVRDFPDPDPAFEFALRMVARKFEKPQRV